MSKEKLFKVFVYGSLLKGQHNHDRILKDSQFVTEATIRGNIYHLGGFPAVIVDKVALKHNNDIVVGEVYEVNQNTLDQLDILEGVSFGMYERKLTTATRIDEKTMRVYYYEYKFAMRHNAIKLPSNTKWSKWYEAFKKGQ